MPAQLPRTELLATLAGAAVVPLASRRKMPKLRLFMAWLLVAVADDVQALGDLHGLLVGPRRHVDGVAGVGVVDRGLDRLARADRDGRPVGCGRWQDERRQSGNPDARRRQLERAPQPHRFLPR